jgi:hypothetical protein
VEVVFSAVDGNQNDCVFFADSVDVRAQTRLEFEGKKPAAVFGAENHVENILGERVRHRAAFGVE